MRENVDKTLSAYCYRAPGNILVLRMSGVLEHKDYERFLPEIERIIAKYGGVRLLIELVEFHGWTNSAAWEDTRFGLKYWRNIERMAIVSDQNWLDLSMTLRPFMVRYFNASDFDMALGWVNEASATDAPLEPAAREC